MMRIFLFALFLAMQVSFSLPAEVVARFSPLQDNERFAFAIQAVSSEQVNMQRKVIFYAVTNNDIENISKLFTWENVIDNGGIQFTSNFRTAFFAVRGERRQPNEPLLNHHFFNSLYMANGDTGEIKKVMPNVMLSFRVSKDGRFVGFINGWRLLDFENNIFSHRERQRANIFIFDIKNNTMRQFEWGISRPMSEGFWSIRRVDNIFRIYAVARGGYILAVADLAPTEMQLRTLWDRAYLEETFEIISLPNIDAPGWYDDISFQFRNPNVRLQRR